MIASATGSSSAMTAMMYSSITLCLSAVNLYKEGEDVEFEITEGPKGPMATAVSKL